MLGVARLIVLFYAHFAQGKTCCKILNQWVLKEFRKKIWIRNRFLCRELRFKSNEKYSKTPIPSQQRMLLYQTGVQPKGGFWWSIPSPLLNSSGLQTSRNVGGWRKWERLITTTANVHLQSGTDTDDICDVIARLQAMTGLFQWKYQSNFRCKATLNAKFVISSPISSNRRRFQGVFPE